MEDQTNNSLLQYTQSTSTKMQIIQNVDMFSFIPVPITNSVSTKRSIFASLLLILIFLSYVGYGMFQFLTNNTPRINQYYTPIMQYNRTTPEIAINFFYGDPYKLTINDSNTFYFTFQQCVRSNQINQSKTCVDIASEPCSPSWLPDLDFELICPVVPLNISGLLYYSDYYIYPTININLCDYKAVPNACIPLDQLYNLTSGGRILLFLHNESPELNLASESNTNAINYDSFQYFLVPFIYNRAEIVLQEDQYEFSPNYLTSFKTKQQKFISFDQQNFYNTNTSIFGVIQMFQIWIRLNQNQRNVQVIYSTIIDMISSWGALWGVLFAGFSIYFITHNQNKFYNKNPDWKNFQDRLHLLEEQKEQSGEEQSEDIQILKLNESESN